MSASKILIYAFTLRRDVASALLLKKSFENRGALVALVTGYNLAFYIKYWRPDFIIISSISKIDYVKALAPSSKIILLPGEGGEPDLSSNARMLSERGGQYEKLDKIMAWGVHDLTLFKKYFPDNISKIKVCGNPRLDLIKLNKERLIKKNNKKTIGFIGRFNSLNHYDGRPTIYTLNYTENLDSVTGQIRGYVLMVETIKYIIKNTGFDISIRPHPLEAPENYKYLLEHFPERVQIDDSLDLANWMEKQRIVCSPSSTSFLEAYLTRTVIINLDEMTNLLKWVKKNQAFAALSIDAGKAPRNKKELIETISNPPAFKLSKKIEEHLKLAHGWELEGTACNRIAKEIIPIITQKKPNRLKLKFLNHINQIKFLWLQFKNPLFKNFNYCEGIHKPPPHLNTMLCKIDEEK